MPRPRIPISRAITSDANAFTISSPVIAFEGAPCAKACSVADMAKTAASVAMITDATKIPGSGDFTIANYMTEETPQLKLSPAFDSETISGS